MSLTADSIKLIETNIKTIVKEKLAEEEERRKQQQLAMLEAKKKKQEKNGKGKNNKNNNKKGGKGGKKEEEKKEEEIIESELAKIGLIGLEEFVGRKKQSIQSRDINVEGITIAFGPDFLLDNGKLALNWGSRYGLVGRNG